jgi:hypothetical protein
LPTIALIYPPVREYLYKNGYMALSVNEWSNLERMGYTDPIILSKLEKYSTIPSEKTKEEIFSNFIYIKSFSTDADFLNNVDNYSNYDNYNHLK